MVTHVDSRARGAPSLLTVAVAGYAGYRIAKSGCLRRFLLILSVVLFVAAALYAVVLLLELVAALVMTAVRYTVHGQKNLVVDADRLGSVGAAGCPAAGGPEAPVPRRHAHRDRLAQQMARDSSADRAVTAQRTGP